MASMATAGSSPYQSFQLNSICPLSVLNGYIYMCGGMKGGVGPAQYSRHLWGFDPATQQVVCPAVDHLDEKNNYRSAFSLRCDRLERRPPLFPAMVSFMPWEAMEEAVLELLLASRCTTQPPTNGVHTTQWWYIHVTHLCLLMSFYSGSQGVMRQVLS